MGTDVTPYSGGGSLVVTDGGGGDLALHQQQAAAHAQVIESAKYEPILTDAEHFLAYRDSVVEAFAAIEVRDPKVVDRVVQAAQHVTAEVGKGSLPMEIPKLASAFGQQLVRTGVTDARQLGAALGVGFQYLLALDELQREQRDYADRVKGQAELQKVWGANYRANLKAIKAFLAQKMPMSLVDVIENGRDMDGRLVANSVPTMQWLAEIAGGQVQGAAGPSPDALRARAKEIEGIMRTDLRRYRRERLDAELDQIYEKLGE